MDRYCAVFWECSKDSVQRLPGKGQKKVIFIMHGSFVPEAMSMLFWDVDPAALDLELHKDFIIERVLNMGDEKSLKWLWHEYGERVIYDTVINSRGLTLKTARCWQNYFNLKEEQMRCFSAFSKSPDSIC
ncbi:MAG: DUF6922 domain-containing protein [Dethiobacteria bacterium]|jgi:hypothetical protein